MTRKPSTNDDVETVLSEWWQELLGIERPDGDDDFFELGGHSLLVVRLFSKLKKTFGVNIDSSSFFEAERSGLSHGAFATDARRRTACRCRVRQW